MIWQTTLILMIIACCVAASATALIQMLRRVQFNEKPIILLSTSAMVLIVILLGLQGISKGRIPVFGRLEALCLYSLALFASYIYMAIRSHTRGISAIVLPFITLIMLLTLPCLNGTDPAPVANWPAIPLALHVASAFIGYGFFTTTSFLAIVYLIQDHNLKKKNLGFSYETFPSLENLDLIMRRQIKLAFLAFTVSIAFGIIVAHRSADVAKWIVDPKTAASVATWIVYAVLLHLRTKADQHGKKIAIATIVGLLFVLFTFFGVHTLAESTHDFITTSSGN